MPRKQLICRAIEFVRETERQSSGLTEDARNSIAHSDEFKALIARIAAEL